jgi:hypothetical protein
VGAQYGHLRAGCTRHSQQAGGQKKEKAPAHQRSFAMVESISSLAEMTREFIS